MSILKLPSVKLFAKHIHDCLNEEQTDDQIPKSGSASKPNFKTWTCTIPQGTFRFSVVWIQGHIVEVEQDEKSAVISDGTGQILLTACNKVTGKPEIKKDMYMMAVGTLTGSEGPPEMKPFKLQNLSHVDHVQECWHLEVIDQIHHLTSNQVT